MKNILNIFIFCSIALITNAQQYSFRVYSLDEGLPQSEVWAIMQDSRGLMWIGTNGGGLCRFNGIDFKVFTRDDGLASAQIWQIFEDSNTDLWLATQEGITRYDGKQFINFNEKDGVIPGKYSKIYEDHNQRGKIWIGVHTKKHEKKLMYFENNRFHSHPIVEQFDTTNNEIIQLAQRNDGVFFISSMKGIYEFDGTNIKPSIYNDYMPEGEIAIPLIQDKDSSIYFVRGKVEEMEFKLSHFKDQKIIDIPLPEGVQANRISNFFKDTKGNIWFNPNKQNIGILKYDGENYTFFSDKNGLPGNSISCITEDKEGNIWIGTSGSGMAKYQCDHFVFFNAKDGLKSEIVRSIYQDKKGNMWFGTTSGGISRFDGQHMTTFLYNENNNIHIVSDISENDNGDLLISTNKGLYEFNGSKFILANTKYGIEPKHGINEFSKINGEYWFCMYGSGIHVWNGENTREIRQKTDSIISDYVLSAEKDSKGNIWICTQHGLSKYDGKSSINFTQEDGLPNGMIFQFAEDKYGRIWFSSFGGGLVIYENNSFRIFSKESGLSSNLVYSVLADPDGNIWAGTQLGVDKIALNKEGNIEILEHYGKYDGFVGVETNGRANFVDKEGNLWFGTIKGAMKYNPGKKSYNDIEPVVRLSNLKLFFKTIHWKDEQYKAYVDDIYPWTNIPVDLKLPYNFKHLTFEFEGLSYTVPERVLYQWKLKGFDTEWSPPTTKREAVYSNIPSGKYTFMVKASNNDGVWTETPVAYNFEITAPIWVTWKFWLIALSFLLGAVYAGFRMRLTAIKAKKRELEHLVKLKTSEIRKQNEELIELNNEKNHLIGIVAHDLRNPLTSSLTIANLLKSEPGKLDEEQVENVSYLVNALNRMSTMVNKILDIRVIESKKINMNLERTNIAMILKQVFTSFEERLRKKELMMDFSVETQEIYANVDKNFTLQVFENLVSNAIKFSPPQKQIHVKLCGDNGKLRTEITDEGPGLTKDDKKKAFKKFQTLSAKPTANEKSTGLGLSIVKKYVEAMEGKVWCESRPGKGATFIVEFSKAS